MNWFKCIGMTWLGCAVSAAAATYTIPGNFANLQAAHLGAPDGSTILVGPGTYGYIEALNRNKQLYFRATGGPAVTFIDGGNSTMLLRFENGGAFPGNPDKTFTFDGFTFQRGRGVNGSLSPVNVANAKAAFLNCVFQDNSAFDKGGAVLIYGLNTEVFFTNCKFLRNKTDRNGGAVLVNGGHPQAYFKDCLFEDNSNRTPNGNNGNEGGAILFGQAGGKVVNCTFRNNASAYDGGAIMCLTPFTDTMDTVLVHGCRFDGDFAQLMPGAPGPTAPDEGGAISVENNMLVDVQGCYFTNCSSQSAGAVMNYRAKVRIRNCTFDRCVANGTNTLGFGGAIAANSYDDTVQDYPVAQLWVEDTMIRNCTGPVGGGIFIQGDTLRAFDSAHQTELYLNNVVIENCRATTAGNSYGNGGGAFFNLARLQATNLMILNSRGENFGGGFVSIQSSTLNFRDSFVVGCSAGVRDAAYHCPSAPFPNFVNTVVAYNGSGTASTSALLAVPKTSYGPVGHVGFVSMPYSGLPAIAPRIGVLPNRIGFAAGSVLDAAMTTSTTYTLTSQHAPKTSSVTYTPYGIDGVAYGSVPWSVPGTIEAENFNTLGRAISYRDLTPANDGGAYRTSESVDIGADPAAGNGHVVGNLAAGEWLEYDIRVEQAGSHLLTCRVSSGVGGGSFYAQVDGVDVSGVLTVTNTGGWSSFVDLVRSNILLTAGDHIVRVVVVTPGFNVDSFRFAPASPRLDVQPSSLLRTVKVGGTAAPLTLNVRNAGGSNLFYAISADAAWLTVSPTNGSSSGETDAITLSFASAALATGEYTTVVSVVSAGSAGSPAIVPVTLRVRPSPYALNDHDGDASGDLVVYHPPSGGWYVQRSSLGFQQAAFGYAGTVPVAGDFDGDGRADLALYNAAAGLWHISASGGSATQVVFGYAGTVPVAADYDGDGRHDRAVYDAASGTWFLQRSTLGFTSFAFGYAGTRAFPADYDGDGRADAAVYHAPTGQWHIQQSTAGFRAFAFGFSDTLPVAADFDGDGKADPAVYHPPSGTWYILRSAAGFTSQQFGFAGTVPVPADYDGDGRADIAVYHAPSGSWYLQRSSAGFLLATFGFGGTLPPGAPVP